MLDTYKLVFLQFGGVQGQNLHPSEPVKPIADTLKESMAIIRRASGSQVDGDDDEDKSRERGRHGPGDVVPVGRHGIW